ncbi:MAG: four helix bundle protein [Candidatus Peribacteraceae bacterium]|jgi:four helix bundle protein
MQERPYQKLIVWKEAHQLCKIVYELTKTFPAEEKFGLVSQMRRAAYGIPMNLAEGNGRRSKKEKLRYIDIATASLEELHYQIVLALDLSYIAATADEQLNSSIQRIGYLLVKLRSSLL